MMLVYANLHTSPKTPLCVTHLEIFAYFAKISPVRPPRATALARMAADAPTAGSLSQSILRHAL